MGLQEDLMGRPAGGVAYARAVRRFFDFFVVI